MPVNLREFEALAREIVTPMAWAYYAGGANDEVTLREADRAWDRFRLRPRVLVDVSAVDTRTTILGTPLAFPVLTAPCALNRLAHPDGEVAVARAAAASGIVQVLSTASSTGLEEVATAVPAPRWFQLYCYRDLAITEDLVRRAESAGYTALCLTVDVPILGRREREVRASFAPPAGVTMKILERYANDQLPMVHGESALAQYVVSRWDASLTWDVVSWLRTKTALPIVLKGILTGEDAALAVQHGAHAIVVSTHGGRQLDRVVASAAALGEVVASVQGGAEVLVDGGIRRGTDVLVALALGARAVLIGRPYLWGLAVDGEAGVRHVLQLLHDEFALAMALSGRAGVGAIDASVLAR